MAHLTAENLQHTIDLFDGVVYCHDLLPGPGTALAMGQVIRARCAGDGGGAMMVAGERAF
jgi:hypothetical protein